MVKPPDLREDPLHVVRQHVTEVRFQSYIEQITQLEK
jgi:hypothetical protein